MKRLSDKARADNYDQLLLSSWEEVYKKGQMTFWLMLALKDSPKHMSGIKDFISKATNGTLEADDQSMYRALRRYYNAELLEASSEAGSGGPERKVYSLSPLGIKVLEQFSKRNICNVYYKKDIKELVERNV